MIDFRYHIVSLISVFLALAVGIVLGAGPLRENLGDQLAGQVEQLRTEKEQMRSETEALGAQNDQLASFIAELGPELVSGTLDGQQVAVLTDDSSTRPATEKLTALLNEAGVPSPMLVDLQPALWTADQEEDRGATLAEIQQLAPGLVPEDGGEELTSSAKLSALIPVLLRGDGGEITPELRDQLWKVLEDHHLVVLDGAPPEAVDGVIYASAAPKELTEPTEDETAATERAQGLLTSQTSLLGALAESGGPSVVSAATPGNDASTGLVHTVRGDQAFDALSTTDRLQEPDGPLLSVLALIQQTRGGSGAYGTTGDAENRLPQLPETLGLEQKATEQGQDGGGSPSDGGGAE